MEAENMFEGLNENELPMDCIESPFYGELRMLINEKLDELLTELDRGEFQEGDINVKLTLGTMLGVESIPQEDGDTGGERQGSFEFRIPGAEWNVKLTLKKSSGEKGRFGERRAFKRRGERYIAVPVREAQMSFDDELRGRRDQE